jgi:hypothetical protein
MSRSSKNLGVWLISLQVPRRNSPCKSGSEFDYVESGTARFKTNRSRSPLMMRKLLLAYFLIPHRSCFPGSHCPLAFAYIFLDLLFYFLGICSGICWFHVRECFSSILMIILHSNTSFCLIFRFIMNMEHLFYPIAPVFMVRPSL